MTIKPSPRLAGSVRRVLVSVGLGATLVLGSAGAASAGTWSHNDAVRDVVAWDEENDTSEPAPERAAGDIQRIAVSHMQSKLVVRLNLRQGLSRTEWGIIESIRTPRATFDLLVYRFEGMGGIELYRSSNDGDEVRCRGIEVTYGTRSVQIAVPTRCLGTPGAVKVGAMTYTWENEELSYLDDAFRRGVGEYGPRLSPVIRRG